VTRDTDREAILLADVLRDDGYRALRGAVREQCLREIRERRQGELDPLERVFRETVRAQCLAAIRSRRRRVPIVFGIAAAAALVVLVGASMLLQFPGNPPPYVAGVEPAIDPVPDLPEERSVTAQSRYAVPSRPLPAGAIVRTADRMPNVEIIGDDALLDAVPGIAIARVGDPQGPHKVLIRGPGIQRVMLLQ
jgi:hypothetical protein